MSSPPPPGTDNRRAVLRAVVFEVLKAQRSLAKLHNGDMFALMVFTTIWSANGEHLIGDPRYAGLRDIAPDSTITPITDDQLQRALGAPRDMVDRYVKAFLEDGWIERVPGGLAAPRAVFTSPEMMDAANEVYDRIIGLVSALRLGGFGLGEEPTLS